MSMARVATRPGSSPTSRYSWRRITGSFSTHPHKDSLVSRLATVIKGSLGWGRSLFVLNSDTVAGGGEHV